MSTKQAFELRRVVDLPPYVFATTDTLKLELRRAGEDVIDLGFGNPDLPSHPLAVEKLKEAAENERNHRYSQSRGIPNLRKAICGIYQRKFGVELDYETQAINTIGAKEGLAHLMWVLLGPGDAAVAPCPSYPIHRFAPKFAGAEVFDMPMSEDVDLFESMTETFRNARPRPRVILFSFPHNPTAITVEREFMEKAVAFAREQEVVLVHDFAYADLAFDGYKPPSLLEIEGGSEVGVELYTLTKSFSMAGWRVGFVLGNADIIQGLARLKSYLDYGTFQPIQIAATVVMNEHPFYPREVSAIYESRRNALCDGLNRIGWEIAKPRGSMFVWAKIPEPYRKLGSMEFAIKLMKEAKVAVNPGIGFGPGGDEHVRFALIENEQRIAQGVRGIRRALAELG
jgi:alanine-synthesizing transaminase